MERQSIICGNPNDRETLAAILVKNGYTVRVKREKKGTGSAYIYLVEYWRE